MSNRLQAKVEPYHYHKWLMISFFLILALGLLMVTSASMVISDRQYGYPFHYFIRQSVYLLLGLGMAYIVTRIDMKFWRAISGYLLLVCFILLVLVLIPGIGREVNGSRRWINLIIVNLQVSEVVKFCVVIYLAGYLVRHSEQVRTQFVGFVKPMVLLALISGLLLLEPDFGATAVIMATAMVMMFLAGMRLWQFILLLVLVVGALALIAVAAPYRLERLTTFMHPWANQFGSGYQLTQSLIAFGRGGIFGVGLGNSIQKLFYLPEAHTDFLFAVLAEELGLLGELLVIGLFSVMVGSALKIGRCAQIVGKNFEAYMAYGFAIWLGMQAMINIGVNSGMLPTKGLTLPLMSYGGSSMLINCVVIGILLRIAHEAVRDAGVAPVPRSQRRRSLR